MNLINNLKWRYATKQFDSTKKISDKDLEILKEAIQLSVSSYGLQLYKVLIVENKKLREKLKPASWNQSQITDASHLVIFCNYTKVVEKNIDDYIHLIASTQNLNSENLKGYGDFMKEKVFEMPENIRENWTSKQTYLALGNLLIACAELKIDACPMEGFEVEKYNEILELKNKGLSASVIATIGYRAQEDETYKRAKVRKPISELFETI